MVENEDTFRKIDELKKDLGLMFQSLQAQIAKLEMRLRSVELDFMYNNVANDVYLAKKQKISQKISDFDDLLVALKKTESDLQENSE